MLLKTKHFGEMEINEDSIISFDDGLLGFENIKQYTIILNPDKDIPFHWLQSVDEPNLAFVITNPFQFKQDYTFDIPDKVVDQLEIKDKEDVAVFSIAVVPENIEKMTINLRGPVIINSDKQKGKQLVLDSEEYTLKHHIFQPTMAEQIG